MYFRSINSFVSICCVILLVSLLLNCKKTDNSNQEIIAEKENEPKGISKESLQGKKKNCYHPLMKVTILPHPPNFDTARSIDFCYYLKVNQEFHFYSSLGLVKPFLVVDDENSIKW